VVQLLIATGEVDIDSNDKDNRTPLWWAAERGYETIVKLLIVTGRVGIDLKD
jgi:ankyrin repeat protein